jgi:uncharacterized metal-binding protein
MLIFVHVFLMFDFGIFSVSCKIVMVDKWVVALAPAVRTIRGATCQPQAWIS